MITKVHDLGPLSRDAGPCDARPECLTRATRKINIAVAVDIGWVQVTGHVCDVHAKELGLLK